MHIFNSPIALTQMAIATAFRYNEYGSSMLGGRPYTVSISVMDQFYCAKQLLLRHFGIM